MKLIHTSDIHLGKRLFNSQDVLEEQEKLLNQLLDYAVENDVEAILIAGDVFDRVDPSASALSVLNRFYYNAAMKKVKLFLISGNHDSALRLHFGSDFFDNFGIHINSVYNGKIEYYDLENPDGKDVRIHMLPFVRPGIVNPFLEQKVDGFDEAFNSAFETLELDEDRLNLLMAHQFFLGKARSEDARSEDEFNIGDQDRIPVEKLNHFDYCALGHLHKPQKVADTAYYSGTLMKFSVSEANHKKGFNVLDITDRIEVQRVELEPIRDIRILKDYYETLISDDYRKDIDPYHFYKIILKDKDFVPEANIELRKLYPNLAGIPEYEQEVSRPINRPKLQISDYSNPNELISQFFEIQTGKPLSKSQEKFVVDLWGEKNNASN